MFKKSIIIAALLFASAGAFTTADAGGRLPTLNCDASYAPGGVCVDDPSKIRDHRTPQTVRDHRCPASQGGNCVGPEVQVVVPPPPPNTQPPGCGVAGCNPRPPRPQQTDCDPRFCDDFGQVRPPRRPPVVIIDPIDMGGGQYGISCSQGRSIVRNSGFRRVRAIDCSGRRFTYLATRRGNVFEVVVNRRGRIVDVYQAR